MSNADSITPRGVVTFLALGLMAMGCEKCAPGLVAQGVSQLTIRNFGSIVEMVNEDTVCGFESEVVKEAFVLSGEPGTQGAAVWTVTDCVIDIPKDQPIIKTDCNGVATAVAGKITVSGTRTIEGYLTGDPGEPAIPRGPDAVTIEITSAEFDHFQVDSSDNENFMIMKTGSIRGKLKPLLAAAADTGVCSIPTRNIQFSDIEYTNALVRVITGSRDFLVPVPTSKLSAVNGKFGDRENVISGRITVWESDREIPNNKKEPALNPDYDPDVQATSYECVQNISSPPNFESCTTDIRPLIAQGASQLSVQTIGNLALLLDEDTNCGFASDAVNLSVEITGPTGERGGQGLWTIAQPCTMTFDTPTEIDTDCNGKSTMVQGTVHLTGTKLLNGIPSGDPAEPVVPTTRDPALVNITADFDNFAVWTTDGDNKLTAQSGQLSATIHPRVARDTVRGACSLKTPNSGFSNITWKDARLVVESEGRRFEVLAENSNLEAQNGSKNGRTNYLAGTITLDGETFDIPTGTEPILDPNYDEAKFVASYACKENLEIAHNDEVCDMRRTVGEGAARLIVRTVGAVTSLTNANKDCGFEAIRVLLRPSRVEGDIGQQGLMEWEISDCAVGLQQSFETDCLGREKFAVGSVHVDAKRTVLGEREKLIDIGSIELIDSIIPQDRTSVEIQIQRARLNNFHNYELDPGQSESSRAIRIESAELSATVRPVTGENQRKPGRFDIASPVADMSNIRIRNADVTIFFEGKTFKVRVDDTNLTAFNGSFDQLGKTNMISGTITVDGRVIDFPAASGLDPDYEQRDFDARYACTEDLTGVVPSSP